MILAANADTDELIKRIRNLYEAVARFDAGRLYQEYPKFLNACTHARNSGYPRARIPELLEAACREHDTPEHPVPLDLWLRLGESREGNCFGILEAADAAILDQDPVPVIRESELMKRLPYREAAQIYIDRNGEGVRTVRWLNRGRASVEKPPDGNKASGNRKKQGHIRTLFGKK